LWQRGRNPAGTTCDLFALVERCQASPASNAVCRSGKTSARRRAITRPEAAPSADQSSARRLAIARPESSSNLNALIG